MVKTTKVVATCLIVMVLSANLTADVVQVDISGSFKDSYSGAPGQPANDYQQGDYLTVRLVYDTDLLNEHAETDPGGGFWERWYESHNAILNLSMVVTRDNTIITDRPDGLSYYINQTASLAATSDNMFETTDEEFGFWLADFDGLDPLLNYPVWQHSIEVAFGAVNYEYTPVPFWPNPVLEPYHYSSSFFRIGSRRLLSPGVSDNIIRYDFNLDSVVVTVIPEPATILLLTLGGLVLRRKR